MRSPRPRCDPFDLQDAAKRFASRWQDVDLDMDTGMNMDTDRHEGAAEHIPRHALCPPQIESPSPGGCGGRIKVGLSGGVAFVCSLGADHSRFQIFQRYSLGTALVQRQTRLGQGGSRIGKRRR